MNLVIFTVALIFSAIFGTIAAFKRNEQNYNTILIASFAFFMIAMLSSFSCEDSRIVDTKISALQQREDKLLKFFKDNYNPLPQALAKKNIPK